jgi:nucleotide-binding universal stress UspA family protein
VTVAPSRSGLRGNVRRDVDDDDLGVSFLSQAARDHVEKAHNAAHERAQAIAEEGAATMRGRGVTVTARVIEGDPADAIAAAAEAEQDSLVVISTHGRSGAQRWMLGSVTDKLIRHIATPVLVTTPHEGVEINALVVPLDGSEWAEHALPYAEDIAKALGLSIHLVRSVSLASIGYGLIEDGPAQYSELADTTEEIAREYIEFAAENVRKAGVAEVETTLTVGPTDAAIIDEIGPAGDKLTVMASHGRSGVNRWVLGSVADRVIRHGAGPVLLVPSRE